MAKHSSGSSIGGFLIGVAGLVVVALVGIYLRSKGF